MTARALVIRFTPGSPSIAMAKCTGTSLSAIVPCRSFCPGTAISRLAPRTAIRPAHPLQFGEQPHFTGIYRPPALNISSRKPSYTTNNSIMYSRINNRPLHTGNTRPQLFGRLAKAILLSGALFIGWAAQAQTTNNNMSGSDTARRAGMHRHWAGRNGSDSASRKDGFRRGGPGSYEGWADRRGDRQRGRGGWAHRDGFGRGFGRGRGFRGDGIRYTPEQRKQVMAI